MSAYSEGSTGESSGFTCLVVDDHAENRGLIRRMIESAAREARIIEAADGGQAKELIASSAPDVLISDIQMPNMDGWALLRWLRGEDRYRRIPVMLVSSIDPEELRSGASRSGVSIVLSRPFLYDEFREAFARLQAERAAG